MGGGHRHLHQPRLRIHPDPRELGHSEDLRAAQMALRVTGDDLLGAIAAHTAVPAGEEHAVCDGVVLRDATRFQ